MNLKIDIKIDIYTKRINNTTQTRNSTVLWWLLGYQVTLYYSNIFGISINVSKQSFPNWVLKSSGYIFWMRLLWLKTIKNCCKSEVSSHQIYSKMLRQFSKASLISISSQSLKIHQKFICIVLSGLTFADDSFCSMLWMSPCVAVALQLYNV